ncbi:MULTISPECIES: glycoside hydrolase family 95-like protein [unclassified Rathayibacter]|uniref:glycosyl hydrolase family 95 catalytic domain-containing protein n=1 Tax=unclassified Rathayibacter TaxID=2609250 RepID=UPI0010D78EC6|nr:MULTISPECIES: glycoside hydrolase N-terminal domain-containing protein [unclassified Rathayibacter]TCL83266.1 glycosyl hydrolase family 65 [Rathayibacter sp. PhB192]TCM28764.1 glycosyl hydrolase family 65 [Rathayibacter sp. PhB179]
MKFQATYQALPRARKEPIISSIDSASSRTDLLVTATAAPTWEEGLIVGSGRVGAVVHGPADALTVSLAHERYFLPVNARPAAPDLAGVRDELRSALLAGDADAASEALTRGARSSGYDGGLIWTDPLGICATVSIRTAGGVASSRRLIDPRLGEVAVEWTDLDGGRHAVRLIAPHGGESVRLCVESDRDGESVVELGLGAGDATSFDTGVPDASAVVEASVEGGATGRLVALAGTGSAETGGERVRAVVTAATGTPWQVEGDVTRSVAPVAAGAPRLLRLDLSLSDGEPVADDLSWTDLRTAQRDGHGRLVGASALDLAGASSAVLTEDLWDEARAGDEGARRRVVELAYLSGRANIVASTGELPPTLQGVWQGTWRPAWSADYTLNGNVQNGAMAGMIPTGTPELALSILELVLPHLDDYRENARLVYGAEGMLLPSRMSTHGRADHFAASYPHLFWTGCGGWVLRLAADAVAATGDRGIVDDRLWELAEGVLRFAETGTIVVDGVRRIVPSYSPENTPGGARSPLAVDATIDVAVLRDAARATALLGRARGDDSLDERWARVVAELPEYRVAEDGTLAEWIDPRFPEEIAHRHASQLYPLWYGGDAAFVGDGAAAVRLRAAAAATVAAKIAWRAEAPTAPPGRMEMAFGLVQVGTAAAALGDAESALTCAEWLAVEHWSPTLTTRHDAGRIFNLDASGGLPGLVAAMLLGSDDESLTVLPALPSVWARGAVTGLRARGGLVVDRLEWEPGRASLTVRQVPGAEWLAPAGGTRLRTLRGAVLRVDGREVSGGLPIGAEAVRVDVEWRD